jgi:MFS family permease
MTGAPTHAPKRLHLLLLAAGLAQFLVCADYFAVAIALPPMAKELGVRAIDLQWVITGYVLSFCAVLAIAGPLGDRYGRKKLLQLGIIIFGLVSIWVGLAQTAVELVAARIALGVGGGLLFPLSTAVVTQASTEQSLPRSIALLSGIATLGTAVGPVLGGVLTETLGWRWIFFVNVPISVLALLMVHFFASESRDPDAGGRLDFWGIILLVIGISGLSVGIDRIPHWPLWAWSSLTGGGALLLLGFVVLESRLKVPIIDIRLFANRDFLGFSLAGLLANSAWCIMVFVSTLQLQKVLEFSVLKSGLIYLFLSGSVAAASFIAPRMQRRLGTENMVRLALFSQFLGIGLLFFKDTELWIAIGMFIAGFGCGWGWSMSQAGAIRTLPREKSGLASGSILTIMIMSGNTAIVVIAMLIDLYPDDLDGISRGIQTSFLLTALVAAVGLLPAFFILRAERPDAGREMQ